MADTLLTLQEVANLLKVAEKTVYTMAQLLYKEIADMATERIKAAITLSLVGENPVKAILDAYNPTGSTPM